jgi:6-pyruvoyltetrahydropterin/6-carboxytetrahydropterin synthase
VFTIIVECGFSAIHQLRLPGGTLEQRHGHDWIVRAHFSRSTLSDADMVIDFAEAQAALRSVIEPLQYADLNSFEPLSGLNPTAEVVAKFIFDRLSGSASDSLRRVEVTEAPGCIAAYEPTLAADRTAAD